MENDKNILLHLTDNENDATKLLYALCTYRPVLDVLVKLFTNEKFSADDITWNDLDIHTSLGVGKGIPDLVMQGEKVTIVVEVKIRTWTGLTDNQPCAYLQWLAARQGGDGFFVALIPHCYTHLSTLQSRIARFATSNTQMPVITKIVEWDALYKMLIHHNLDCMNAYVRDFCQLLKSWYDDPLLRFDPRRYIQCTILILPKA